MGAGIVAHAGPYSKEWSVPLGLGTTGRAQLMSVIEALRKPSPDGRSKASAEVVTSSKYVLGALQGGWKVKVNLDLIDEARKLMAEYRSVHFTLCENFDGNAPLVHAQRLAEEAAVEVVLEQPAMFSMTAEEETVKVEAMLQEVMRRILQHRISPDMISETIADQVMEFFLGSSSSCEDMEDANDQGGVCTARA
jgi:ribonuclease HI